LIQQVASGKQNRVILVILAPVVQLPVELEKLFVVVEHDLPSQDELEQIARGIATEEGELPEDAELQSVLDAAAGLTRMEAENAFSLSLVRENRITADAVWELKTQTLKKSGTLTLYQGQDDFSSLGGLAALKTFCKRALLSTSQRNHLHRPRGVMLLSPPGCGKSQFCKTLGKEVGRPVLQLDVGSLMGSLVGQSEERTRAALKIIDAMAPCILMLDEVEKAFSGIGGSGDSGVAARMFGTFLSWLNDHESDVFVVCTANDVSKLPPEFSRSERFDGIFFLDLPSREEKDAIWQLYRQLYEIDPAQRQPDDRNWTGAEIKSCCRLAALLDVSLAHAARNVVPVAVTSAESIDRLRTWASGRCLSASELGIYSHSATDAKSRRRVSREPSAN
jgi:SpoVK/Ycf46/Vps4 family AAA+-type ATPase